MRDFEKEVNGCEVGVLNGQRNIGATNELGINNMMRIENYRKTP